MFQARAAADSTRVQRHSPGREERRLDGGWKVHTEETGRSRFRGGDTGKTSWRSLEDLQANKYSSMFRAGNSISDSY